ncbi:MAG: type I-E CRISPR-associated protein Cas6/Cse3/CasE, partial [Deltaproteobacteria bacterium]|nr:type I-E CRISPR-associated protein Cas6/Cse3/CasE [Deltaproteobacteria bacterium]
MLSVKQSPQKTKLYAKRDPWSSLDVRSLKGKRSPGGIELGNYAGLSRIFSIFLALSLSGCALLEKQGRKAPSLGLIITPPSYYTTRKARDLGERYNRNLEQLVQQLVQDSVTGKLQFANNIASTGGIGFFTHSASKTADERYLEVILGVPDVLKAKTDFSSKVDRLFSQYGLQLLSILSSDSDIYNDREVAGYGLNFSWRTTSKAPSGSRITLERAVIYIPKEEVRRFLNQRISGTLLSASVIFAIQAGAPARQVTYLLPGGRPRPAPEIRETAVAKRPEIPKIELNPRSRRARYEIAHPYQMHRTVMGGFPQFKPEDKERILFRVDDKL